LIASLGSRIEDEKFGFQYFDRPLEPDEDEEDDEFELRSCAADCCDDDCECDDCTRCSELGLEDPESRDDVYAAAA
jgi:hypothetical protein